jgi:hypothetical protein
MTEATIPETHHAPSRSMQGDVSDDGLQFDVSDPANVDWGAISATVWRRYCLDPSERPDPTLRMCPWCGIAFAPHAENHTFCCDSHKNMWNRRHPRDVAFPQEGTCAHCGKPFQKLFAWHIYCGAPCKAAEKYQRDSAIPERVKRAHERWIRAREKHRTRATGQSVEQTELPPVPTTPRIAPNDDIWQQPAPQAEYLPGAGITLDMSPHFIFEHNQISALHGMLSNLVNGHTAHTPDFSLIPWPRGCGWAIYVTDLAIAKTLAAHNHEVFLNGKRCLLKCGPLLKIKAPKIAPGTYTMRIDAITPIHIRSYGSTVLRGTPSSRYLKGTLGGAILARLNTRFTQSELALEMLESSTRMESIWIRGNGAKLGGVSGWVGSVVVRVNAPARWLLECSALGVGYGGKVAWGFGRIKAHLL